MSEITATTPVTAPAVGSMVYDKWFMTQMNFKSNDAEVGKTVISLRRANKTGEVWTLMPNSEVNSSVSFGLDLFKEMTSSTPELATAFAAVVTAIETYATKKNLL